MKIKPNPAGEADAARAKRQVGRLPFETANDIKGRDIKPVSGGDAKRASAGDSLSVSDRAAAVGKLTERIKALPEIRQDRVDALRTRIASSDYQPAAEKIADAILKAS